MENPMMMKKNEIPSSIAVGGVLYGVEFNVAKFDEDFTGEVDYANAKIKIEKDLSPQIAAQTLLSSVVGCILAHSGMSLVLGDKEDCVVECLAYGMLDVLRCNPSLMEYISRLDE